MPGARDVDGVSFGNEAIPRRAGSLRLPGRLFLALLIGAALQGVTYLAAPVLALLAERDIRARRVADRQRLPVPTQASLVSMYGVLSGAGEDTARPPVLTR